MGLNDLTGRGRNPMEVEIYDILREEGIPTSDFWFIREARDLERFEDEMSMYTRFVAKAMSPRIVHKSDFKAVELHIDRNSVATTFERFMRDFAQFEIQGVMFAPMVGEGVEFLIGSTTDPTFGTITIFGIGGTLVEIIKDVTFGKSPVSRSDALEMISRIKHQEMLDGPRGLPVTDRIELAELIEKVSQLSYDYRDIVAEIDLNPVRVTKDGIIPLDARIIFHPEKC
ncbi:MAG: acetate--CoA ligase family protein [Candidatus Kariarchaeaceae archaeon]|jgi:succinyl-CoA synthetase beta subunit